MSFYSLLACLFCLGDGLFCLVAHWLVWPCLANAAKPGKPLGWQSQWLWVCWVSRPSTTCRTSTSFLRLEPGRGGLGPPAEGGAGEATHADKGAARRGAWRLGVWGHPQIPRMGRLPANNREKRNWPYNQTQMRGRGADHLKSPDMTDKYNGTINYSQKEPRWSYGYCHFGRGVGMDMHQMQIVRTTTIVAGKQTQPENSGTSK